MSWTIESFELEKSFRPRGIAEKIENVIILLFETKPLRMSSKIEPTQLFKSLLVVREFNTLVCISGKDFLPTDNRRVTST